MQTSRAASAADTSLFLHQLTLTLESGRPAMIELRMPEQPMDLGDLQISTFDGRVTLTDAIRILEWVFAGEAAHPCLEAANVNNSLEVDVGDAVTLFIYLFMAGPAPLPPFPECGRLGGLAAIPERACRESTCAP